MNDKIFVCMNTKIFITHQWRNKWVHVITIFLPNHDVFFYSGQQSAHSMLLQ